VIGGQVPQPSHQKCRMRLCCRAEIRIHAQVRSKGAAPEPRTSSPAEIRGLRFLRQPGHTRIERARGRFLARRHCQLDVIDVDDFAHNSILRVRRDHGMRLVRVGGCCPSLFVMALFRR
jgi:hypothetical protein